MFGMRDNFIVTSITNHQSKREARPLRFASLLPSISFSLSSPSFLLRPSFPFLSLPSNSIFSSAFFHLSYPQNILTVFFFCRMRLVQHVRMIPATRASLQSNPMAAPNICDEKSTSHLQLSDLARKLLGLTPWNSTPHHKL